AGVLGTEWSEGHLLPVDAVDAMTDRRKHVAFAIEVNNINAVLLALPHDDLEKIGFAVAGFTKDGDVMIEFSGAETERSVLERCPETELTIEIGGMTEEVIR